MYPATKQFFPLFPLSDIIQGGRHNMIDNFVPLDARENPKSISNLYLVIVRRYKNSSTDY